MLSNSGAVTPAARNFRIAVAPCGGYPQSMTPSTFAAAAFTRLTAETTADSLACWKESLVTRPPCALNAPEKPTSQVAF